MIGKAYRGWRPIVGVLAVGMLAFGLSLQGAPAGDISAGPSDRVVATDGSMKTAAAPQREIVLPTVDPPPAVARTLVPRLQIGQGGEDLRWGRVVGSADAGSGAADKGGAALPPGSPCTCDSDCTDGVGIQVDPPNPAVDDPTGHCIIGQCIDGFCESRDQPDDTRCEDGVNTCTIGRCNPGITGVDGDAFCEDPATVNTAVGDLSYCAKNCIGGPTPGKNCTIAEDCGAGTCELKIEGSDQVSCTSTGATMGAYDCAIGAPGSDNYGRCCYDGGAEHLSLADCDDPSHPNWKWMEISDPDDLLHEVICPQYSAGVAPAGAYGVSLGPVTQPAKQCNTHPGDLHGAYCEVDYDCARRCTGGGANDGEICFVAGDCPDGSCVDDTCVPNPDDCNGYVTLGDDYSFLPDGSKSVVEFIQLKEIRWRGNVEYGQEIVVFDFYDASPTPVRVTSVAFRMGDNHEATWSFEVDCGPNDCDITQPCAGGDPACELETDPPVIIPGKGWMVMRASRQVTTLLGPPDLNGHWVSAVEPGGVDVGYSDPNKMWVNGPIGATDTDPGLPLPVGERTLVAEILGTPIDKQDALGACCDPEVAPPDNCIDTYQWLCRHCAGAGATPGTVCDRGEGNWSNIDRECRGDQEDCFTLNWNGNRSVNDYETNAAQYCADDPCALGSCCNDGDCTMTTLGDCGGDFLGYGTECSPPGGWWCSDTKEECDPSDGSPCADPADCVLSGWIPNCCPQPADIGGDACDTLYVCDPDLDPPGSMTDTWCDPTDAAACKVCSRSFAPCDMVGFDERDCLGAGEDCDCRLGLCLGGDQCRQDLQDCADLSVCKPGYCDNDADLEYDPAELHCTNDGEPDCAAGIVCVPYDECLDQGPCEVAIAGAQHPLVDVPDKPLCEATICREVVDVTTDMTVAVQSSYDDCSHGSDPGWYIGFEVTECANVTMNFCCNEPLQDLASSVLYDGCPCQGAAPVLYVQPNTNRSGYGQNCRNNYCCDDGNFSVEWTVGPGQYQYSPVAGKSCEGTSDDCGTDAECEPGVECHDYARILAAHIIFEPCTVAACCQVDWDDPNPCDTVSCSVENILVCENLPTDNPAGLNGDWLGCVDPSDPLCNPVNDCFGDPCGTGSCCTGPGVCEPEAPASWTCEQCTAASDQVAPYHGGVTCDRDPCEVCAFEDQAHCQLTTGQYIYPADRNMGVRAADDFRAPTGGGTINGVCWWHGYIVPAGGSECNDDPPDDDLVINFYEDDLGLPGTMLVGSPGSSASWDARGAQEGLRTLRYHATLETGIVVDSEQCYWIEITGDGEPDCSVLWTESHDGNNYRVRDDNNNWGYEDIRTSDLAFCIDIGMHRPGGWDPTEQKDGGCGDLEVACCLPDRSCSHDPEGAGRLSTCLAAGGVVFPYLACDETWDCPDPQNDNCAEQGPEEICSNLCTAGLDEGYSCQTDDDCRGCDVGCCQPIWNGQAEWGKCSNNDELEHGPVCSFADKDCYDGSACRPWTAGDPAVASPVYRCKARIDNRLASTDGPPSAGDCFGSGADSFQADVWYALTAPCTGQMVIDMCTAEQSFDSMLSVFGLPSGELPVCPGTSNDDHLICNDDFCPGSATLSGLEWPITVGDQYLLRLGGWSGEGLAATAGQGRSEMNIGFMCNPADPDVAAPVPCFDDWDNAPLSCNTDADCETSAGANRAICMDNCDDPPVGHCYVPKNRYLSLDLSCNSGSVAYQVTLASYMRCSLDTSVSCVPGSCKPAEGVCEDFANVPAPVVRYLDTPAIGGGAGPASPSGCAPQDDCYNMWFSCLVDEPVYRTWTEECVHVEDCEIVPGAVYEVEACTAGLAECSNPLTIGTVPKAHLQYGDICGPAIGAPAVATPPDAYINVVDLQAFQKAQRGLYGAVHTTWADIQGDGCGQVTCPSDSATCVIPQQILNVGDQQTIQKAMKGETYENVPGQVDPHVCPVAP